MGGMVCWFAACGIVRDHEEFPFSLRNTLRKCFEAASCFGDRLRNRLFSRNVALELE